MWPVLTQINCCLSARDEGIAELPVNKRKQPVLLAVHATCWGTSYLNVQNREREFTAGIVLNDGEVTNTDGIFGQKLI